MPESESPGSDRSAEAFVTYCALGLCWLFLASAASCKVQLGWKIAGNFESGVDARREWLCPCFHDVSSVIGDPPAGRSRYSGFNLSVYTWCWPNGFPNYFPSGLCRGNAGACGKYKSARWGGHRCGLWGLIYIHFPRYGRQRADSNFTRRLRIA
jgi:hypothetical protein